jgi:N-carbamoyl-L-amino-acid hydrolase
MPGTFGSRTYIGGVSQAEWSNVAPVLAEAGLGAPALPKPSFSPDRCLCYVELHIEQGGVLDASGEDIGVVTGIVWITSFTATFEGEPNHAGTTPMGHRRDALLGAAELALAIPDAVSRLGSPLSVGTCGQMKILPGGRNVIPGEVTMSVEVRDLDGAVAMRALEGIRERAREIAGRRSLKVELSAVSANKGAMMDPRVQGLIEGSANELNLKSRRMPSGAGHDAMNFATAIPTGMIFIPSRGGISHSPAEWSDAPSCQAGAEVLLRTVMAIDAGGLDR